MEATAVRRLLQRLAMGGAASEWWWGEGRGGDRRLPAVRLGWAGLVLAGQPSRDSSPAKQAGRVWSSRSLFTAHASRKQAQPMLGGETSGKQAQSPSNCRLLSPPTLQRALSASDCGRLSWWTHRRASFSSEAPLNCRPERSFQEEVSLIQAGAAPGALCRPAAPNFFSNKQ